MAAHRQTQGEFKASVLEKVEAQRPGLSKTDINAVLNAVVEQAQADLAQGYEVPLLGLVKLSPAAKQGRKKGTVVRNPFDQSERTLKKDEPDTLKVKARAMAAAKSAVDLSPSNTAALISDIG